MGISIQTAKMLLHENLYRPIKGKVLLLGRQTVGIDIPVLHNIFSAYGKELKYSSDQIDSDTRHSTENEYNNSKSEYITDELFFKTLSSEIECIDVLDVSDYEGAEVVADLNKPIDKSLHEKYDFIYDGSVLDNIFNPAQAIENIARMLKSDGGRIFHIDVSSAFPGSMLSPMPEFFYGFYAANKFKDVKVYLAQREDVGDRFMFQTKLWKYSPFYTRQSNYDHMMGLRVNGPCCIQTITIAEKFKRIDEVIYPKNLQYIDKEKGDQDWTQMEHQYGKFDRPVYFERVNPSSCPKALAPLFLTDHYSLIEGAF